MVSHGPQFALTEPITFFKRSLKLRNSESYACGKCFYITVWAVCQHHIKEQEQTRNSKEQMLYCYMGKTDRFSY